jgi:hypothetical protein
MPTRLHTQITLGQKEEILVCMMTFALLWLIPPDEDTKPDLSRVLEKFTYFLHWETVSA